MQASAVVAYLIFNYSIWGHLEHGIYLVPVVILTSLLMVSHIPYDAFPRLSFRGSSSNRIKLILLLLGLVLILFRPSLMFFPVVMVYIIAGGIKGLILMKVRAQGLEELGELDEVEDEGWVG